MNLCVAITFSFYSFVPDKECATQKVCPGHYSVPINSSLLILTGYVTLLGINEITFALIAGPLNARTPLH